MIDTATNNVAAMIPVGNGPVAVAVTLDGSNAYLANFHSNTVLVIVTAPNTFATTIPVGSGPLQ
ncbi:MAG: YncE family protein [Methylocella sp.]